MPKLLSIVPAQHGAATTQTPRSPRGAGGALEFPDGQVVLLTRLCEGQRATVSQLPIGAHPAAAGEAVRREVVISLGEPHDPKLPADSVDIAIPSDRKSV